MQNLVENILALEQEADALIANAQARVREAAEKAEAEIAAYRAELAREIEERLSVFEAELKGLHEEASARVEAELAAGLEGVAHLDPSRAQQQVERILARFRRQ